jgi:hypothetical protein
MATADRIADARFLWGRRRRVSALPLACVVVAARARRQFSDAGDGEGFRRLIGESLPVTLSAEYRGRQELVQHLLYKWIRCELIHTGAAPLDIEIDDQLGSGLALRAGGAPEYVLKLSTGWFDFLIAVADGEATQT